MTDCFALFGFPPRPALEARELKEAYFRLAAALHPDASHGDAERFSALQESLKTLSDPARRLRHLVQLKFPDFQAAAGGLGDSDLFLKVGGALQMARTVSEKRDAAQSVLARAVLAGEVAAVLRNVRKSQEMVRGEEGGLMARLAEMDARWPYVSAAELEGLASRLTYVARWRDQLAEWEFRLAQG